MISEETGLPVPPEGMYWEVKLVGFWSTPRIYLRDSNDRVVRKDHVYRMHKAHVRSDWVKIYELTDRAVYQSACRVLEEYTAVQEAEKNYSRLVGKYPPNKVEL